MREPGFYKVVYHGRNEVAEFTYEGWYTTASTIRHYDDDFDYIDNECINFNKEISNEE